MSSSDVLLSVAGGKPPGGFDAEADMKCPLGLWCWRDMVDNECRKVCGYCQIQFQGLGMLKGIGGMPETKAGRS